MRVRIAAEKCISSGMCVLTAPEVFDQDELEGVVKLVDDHPSPDHHATVREAAAHCPASVIWVDEDD